MGKAIVKISLALLQQFMHLPDSAEIVDAQMDGPNHMDMTIVTDEIPDGMVIKTKPIYRVLRNRTVVFDWNFPDPTQEING